MADGHSGSVAGPSPTLLQDPKSTETRSLRYKPNSVDSCYESPLAEVLAVTYYLLSNLRNLLGWPGGRVGLATPKVAGSTQPVPLSDNNLGQVIHAHMPLSPSSIIWSVGGDALRLGR